MWARWWIGAGACDVHASQFVRVCAHESIGDAVDVSFDFKLKG
jgi:hypothetical protein